MFPIVDSRIKPLNAKLSVLQTKFEGRAAKHNSLIE